MKKDKRIKIELNDTQINFSDLLITDSEIAEDNNQVQVPASELTQIQQIPFLERPSFREVNSPNKPINGGLIAIPERSMGHTQTAPKPFLTSGAFAFIVVSVIVIVDKVLPPIFYVFRRKNKNRILELEISCPFSLHDKIMSSISQENVSAGEVGVVVGIKYDPLRAVVDFSASHKYNLPNKEFLIKNTENQGLRLVF